MVGRLRSRWEVVDERNVKVLELLGQALGRTISKSGPEAWQRKLMGRARRQGRHMDTKTARHLNHERIPRLIRQTYHV